MSIMGGKLEIWRGNVKIDAGGPIEVRFTAWESAFRAVGRTSIREGGIPSHDRHRAVAVIGATRRCRSWGGSSRSGAGTTRSTRDVRSKCALQPGKALSVR